MAGFGGNRPSAIWGCSKRDVGSKLEVIRRFSLAVSDVAENNVAKSDAQSPFRFGSVSNHRIGLAMSICGGLQFRG